MPGTLRSRCRRRRRPKPGWIVDGQQRTLALAKARRQDFPVPVTAFVADTVDVQRDQFLRINNTKPLPRGLVTELLPDDQQPAATHAGDPPDPVSAVRPAEPRPRVPFCGLIRRPSASKETRGKAVITDTGIVQMLEESLTSPVGLPLPVPQSQQRRDRLRRRLDGHHLLDRVRDTFPDAWGKPADTEPPDARRRHPRHGPADGPAHGPHRPWRRLDAAAHVRDDWRSSPPTAAGPHGTWEDSDLRWNAVENLPRHISELSSYLIRAHVQAKAARR